ncbi:MAG: arginyltransferase [Methylococcales bacterium]|nr:MAG: arginyltransferase [Methylococcales bacterium]
MKSIPLLLSQEHPCSYLDNHQAQSLFVHPAYPLTPSSYAHLMIQGFRRSGDQVYSPHCQHCSACLPIRLAVNKFKHNRNQKRCLDKNINTQATIKRPVFEQTHYDMYLRYQTARHNDGEMANASPEDYLSFLGSSWCNTVFVEFSINNELAGVAIIDQFDQAWSAVYTFFEPKFSNYSLGVYAVLWQIEQAKQQQKELLYLGFWIQECQKMTYKSNYQPFQLLIDTEWVEISTL